MTNARSLRGALFNCKAGRPPRLVKAGLQALLDEHKPAFVLLQECNGYVAELSLIVGYRLVIHDICGTGILVRADVEAKFASVHKLGVLSWPYRVNPSRPVRWHPRRAACKAIIDGWLDAVAIHMPPDPETSHLRALAYATGIRRLTRYANDRLARPLLMGGDWNTPGRKDGPDTPRRLAAQIGAEVTYEPGEVLYTLNRKCHVSNLRAIEPAGGSDHALILFTVHRPAVGKAAS